MTTLRFHTASFLFAIRFCDLPVTRYIDFHIRWMDVFEFFEDIVPWLGLSFKG